MTLRAETLDQSRELAVREIVVLIDDDGSTRRGLAAAAPLARHFEVPLQIVAVLPPNSSGARYSALRLAVDDGHRWLARRFDGVGPPVTARVILGDRDVCPICEAYPGAIVVGSMGGAPAPTARLVELPPDLMHHATHDAVVVVGPAATGEWQAGPIGVTLDGSTLAESALRVASAWASAIRVPLEIVQVVPPAATNRGLTCTDYLRSIQRSLATNGIEANCRTIAADDTADAIVEHLSRRRCTLIALATHAARGRRDGIGPVALRVLTLSQCPVLVSRPFVSTRVIELR
jgi:nucleotide-binding universal stress UspA family protein